jgi:predicted heme/steroid binding protein
MSPIPLGRALSVTVAALQHYIRQPAAAHVAKTGQAFDVSLSWGAATGLQRQKGRAGLRSVSAHPNVVNAIWGPVDCDRRIERVSIVVAFRGSSFEVSQSPVTDSVSSAQKGFEIALR